VREREREKLIDKKIDVSEALSFPRDCTSQDQKREREREVLLTIKK
jgi:hypothetical protein